LTDSAIELLNTDYKAFTSRYGEVFVSGFTTGANFRGLMTLSTNDVNVYS